MLNKNLIVILIMMTVSLLSAAASSAEQVNVQIAYVGDTGHTAYLGVQQGLSEANLQGQFLNQSYRIDAIPPSDIQTSDFTQYIAVITAVDSASFREIANHLPGMPVFNLTVNKDALRLDCLENALHVIPSAQMKSDAISQWQKKQPEVNVVAQAWHPDFKKFAARDLNKRFKKAHDAKMDDYAWAGWAAVKIISDTVARENITQPSPLLRYLKTDLSFDGQKGIDMNFRKTGQLRQPILLINDANKIVAEAPVRDIAKPPTVESLGILECGK